MSTSLPAAADDADDLRDLLHEIPELRALRVRRHGRVLTIESGPKGDPVPHARLRRLTVHLWTLEVATHMGRWQATGLRLQMAALVRELVDNFPWVLAPRT